MIFDGIKSFSWARARPYWISEEEVAINLAIFLVGPTNRSRDINLTSLQIFAVARAIRSVINCSIKDRHSSYLRRKRSLCSFLLEESILLLFLVYLCVCLCGSLIIFFEEVISQKESFVAMQIRFFNCVPRHCAEQNNDPPGEKSPHSTVNYAVANCFSLLLSRSFKQRN